MLDRFHLLLQLTDLGMARSLLRIESAQNDESIEPHDEANAGMTPCGTPAWIAPEIVLTSQYTHKVDVVRTVWAHSFTFHNATGPF
jgi:serine/threonine protein kinase